MIFGSNKTMLSDRVQEPQFCTLVLTDSDGTNDYCHVLLTSEPVSPSVVEETAVKAFSIPLKQMKRPLEQAADLFSHEGRHRIKDPTEPHKYASIAFCVRSKSEFIQGMREILEAINNNLISTFEKHLKSGRRRIGHILACSDTLRNMLWVLNEAFNPPPEVALTIKLGSEVVLFPNDPLFGLSHSEYCVQVLFDVLDVGQILALYTSLMQEERVIVISRQRHLLFCICEGLRMLMFPLTWIHIYVPCISEHLFDEIIGCLGIYFFGVSAYLGVEDLVMHFEGATILDIEISRLHVPKPSLFCPAVETKLRQRLQELKHPQYCKFDEVNLKGVTRRPVKDHKFSSMHSRDRYVSSVRHIFLQVWLDALKDFKHFVSRNCGDESEFNTQAFLDVYVGCGEPKCSCKDFWSTVVRTTNFDNFIRQSRWENDCKATDLQNILRSEEEKDSEAIECLVTPTLSLVQMYDCFINSFIKLTPDDQRGHAIKNTATSIMKRAKEQMELYSINITDESDVYVRENSYERGSTLSVSTEDSFPIIKTLSDAYFKPKLSILPVSPAAPSSSPLQIWYGKYGLLTLLKVLDILNPVDIKSISSFDVLLNQLDSAGDLVWQEHLIKAQIFELANSAPEAIVKEYLKAFSLQPHSLPKYKFAMHLADLSNDRPELLSELLESSGAVKRIAQAVLNENKSQLFETVALRDSHSFDLKSHDSLTTTSSSKYSKGSSWL
jgi:hypothetical protein